MLPAIKSIQLKNFLSFGPNSEPLKLGRLNLLIGANGSGKSNLLEAFALLRAAAPPNPNGEPGYTDFGALLDRGGGVREWLWQSSKDNMPVASIEVVIHDPNGRADLHSDYLRHRLAFTAVGQGVKIDEAIENEEPTKGSITPFFYLRYQNGRPYVNVSKIEGQKPNAPKNGEHDYVERKLEPDAIDQRRSVLTQRYDKDYYPEISYLAERYGLFRLYRRWRFGDENEARYPQPTYIEGTALNEDARNLAHILESIDASTSKPLLESYLRSFYWDAISAGGLHIGNTVLLYLMEGNYRRVPGMRLSDGTLRWLWLLAMLLNVENPPPLICLEEPELGLHPDIIPALARLLREASNHTQLIVTTHSDELISEFSDTPEDVFVFEKDEGATLVKQLDKNELADWLSKYKLGQLRAKGILGGNPN